MSAVVSGKDSTRPLLSPFPNAIASGKQLGDDDEKAQDKLLMNLQLGNETARLEKIEVLRVDKQGSQELVSVLQLLLRKEGSVDVQKAIIDILGEWAKNDNQNAQSLLISCLASSLDGIVHLRVVKALKRNSKGDPISVAALQRLLEPFRPDSGLQVAAIDLLGEWAANGNIPARKVLVLCLEIKNKILRLKIVEALGKSWGGDPGLVKAMESLLRSCTFEVQERVIIALDKWGKNGNKAAQEALLPRLKSEDEAVRSKTVEMLEEDWRGDVTLVQALQPLLQEDTPEIKQKVIAILQKWAGHENEAAQEALLPYLMSDDSRECLRTVQVFSHSNKGSPKVIEALKSLLLLKEGYRALQNEIIDLVNNVLKKWSNFHSTYENKSIPLQITSLTQKVDISLPPGHLKDYENHLFFNQIKFRDPLQEVGPTTSTDIPPKRVNMNKEKLL